MNTAKCTELRVLTAHLDEPSPATGTPTSHPPTTLAARSTGGRKAAEA